MAGIEFVVKNLTGQKASANREKFLLLIEDWKKDQAEILGKRSAPAAEAARAPKMARIEGGVANALVAKTIKTLSAVSGEMVGISSQMKAVGGAVVGISSDVKAGFVKVEGEVKSGTCEVKKLAVSVDTSHRQQLSAKDSQIKRLQEDMQILQQTNERQRMQIGKMNRERDEILKAPVEGKLNAIRATVDNLAVSVTNVIKMEFKSGENVAALGTGVKTVQESLEELKATSAAQSKAFGEVRALYGAQAKMLERIKALYCTQAKSNEDIKDMVATILAAVVP